MGLETGDYISNLDSEWPEDHDQTHQGDDHLRLIKNVLKMTFPGDGGGWTGPLTLDLDFLNGLDTTGIPGLITRTGEDPNTIVSIGQTDDDGTDVFTAGVNSFVQNWDDGGLQSATIMNATNVVDLIYPVGSIIYQNDTLSVDPNTRFPGTTWERIPGLTLIGVGTFTDPNGESRTFAYGEAGGSYSHQLTEAELPAHSHAYKGNIGIKGYAQTNGWLQDQTLNEQTSTVGGDQPHENMPPYVVVDIWYRNA